MYKGEANWNEIAKVKDELFETQKNLNSAKDELQIKAVDMYIDGVMSPATALFISLNDLSDFLAALGYASAFVNTAYDIIESLNSFESLSETQTDFYQNVKNKERKLLPLYRLKKKKRIRYQLKLRNMQKKLKKARTE